MSSVKNIEDLPVLIPLNDFAKVGPWSRSTLYRYVKCGKLPVVRCGKKILFPRDRLFQMLLEETSK
ncbi:MAG: helix-turn-helix domain-containing protein [Bacillota bacterium]